MNEIFVGEPPLMVVSYIRVSGRGQLDGDGPDRQRDVIQNFCKTHRLDCRREFFEKAVSGTIDGVDRPEFAAMIQFAESCLNAADPIPIAGIVVERMDRLARDLMVSEMLLTECRRRKLKVFAVDQGALIDMAAEDADPTRILIRQILGALAQWEKSMLVAKLRAARDRARVERGMPVGQAKYGANESERTIVNLIHGLRGTLDQHGIPMTFEAIAQHLTEGGFKTRFGRAWKRRNVQWVYDTTTPTKNIDIVANT